MDFQSGLRIGKFNVVEFFTRDRIFDCARRIMEILYNFIKNTKKRIIFIILEFDFLQLGLFLFNLPLWKYKYAFLYFYLWILKSGYEVDLRFLQISDECPEKSIVLRRYSNLS